jgi:murein DD-endopeptidase MepM/ murein hydrolase activator NlpD
MLHLVHPALPRAAALDPHRLRQQALAVAATALGLVLLVSSSVNATLASAAESAQQLTLVQSIPVSDADPSSAAVSSLAGASAARAEYTVDVRPPLMFPVGANAPIGSGFGLRDQACNACSTNHTGIDWNPGRGTPIVAIADGIVSKIGPAGSTLGVWVAIDHVINGQEITSIYGHMEAGSMPYALGDRVRVGDPVGTVGSTGVTTAPHLHFELRIGGTAINPLPWLVANGAQ